MDSIKTNETPTVRCREVGLLDENCFMISMPRRDDCVIIDPGDDPEEIMKMASGKKIAAILLTHGHFDHIGAVDAISQGKIPVYVHSDDIPCFASSELNASFMVGESCVCHAEPAVVKDGDILHLAGMDIQVIHTPGHTRGSVCYRVGNLLFSGDTLFSSGSCGRTDLPGGDESSIVSSLKKLMPILQHVQLYGGHG